MINKDYETSVCYAEAYASEYCKHRSLSNENAVWSGVRAGYLKALEPSEPKTTAEIEKMIQEAAENYGKDVSFSYDEGPTDDFKAGATFALNLGKNDDYCYKGECGIKALIQSASADKKKIKELEEEIIELNDNLAWFRERLAKA